MAEKKYKYVIDQKALTDFCLSVTEPTEHQLDEINKVITVVFIKHFSNYVGNEDLKQWALLYVLQNRVKYDPSFSAYNFIYTGIRNEIGNKIKKYSHEVFTDDYAAFDNRSYDVSPEELPEEVRKYAPYLLGQKLFSKVKISVPDVLPLMMFLKSNDKKLYKIPDFVEDNPNAVYILYKLLNDYIKGDRDGKE